MTNNFRGIVSKDSTIQDIVTFDVWEYIGGFLKLGYPPNHPLIGIFHYKSSIWGSPILGNLHSGQNLPMETEEPDSHDPSDNIHPLQHLQVASLLSWQRPIRIIWRTGGSFWGWKTDGWARLDDVLIPPDGWWMGWFRALGSPHIKHRVYMFLNIYLFSCFCS
jgi:hypothetical protein